VKPLWWLRRLQAMSVAEVAHRTYRAARHPVERLRMRAGLYARVPAALASWQGPARFYPLDAIPSTTAAADRICRGQREVLGLGWLALGDAPWHVEPLAGAEWPRVDAARVIAAAPPHFDARLTWELNRGHDWVTLARAYAETREPRYAERLTRDLASWRRDNPLGVGINWASAMEAAIRIHSLAWVAGLVGGDAALAAMLHEHATFVADHLARYSSANNHLIVELSGLAVAERVLHGRPHARALAELDRECDRQIFDDGVNAEMATHYHAFVLEALVLVAELERIHGAPRPHLDAVIGRMADYLRHLRCADGSLLQQGDSDDGKILPWHADPFAFLPPQPAPTRSRAFRASGQVVLRSERLLVTFDAGPFGFGSLAAHAHCDALAINVAIDGKPFLVDRGTFRYNGDRAARDRYRMTAAHNTVQVEDREQGEAAGPFLWRRTPKVTLERCDLGGEVEVVVASHDGFAPHVHRRTLLLAAAGLLVIDRITPAAGMVVRWHLAPERESVPLWTAATSVTAREMQHSARYAIETTARSIEHGAQAGLVISALELARDGHDALFDLAVARRLLTHAEAHTRARATS
jgi:hypothetical protein